MLVLKARHLNGSAFCNFYRLEVSEQALGVIPLGFGIVVKDKPYELSRILNITADVRRVILSPLSCIDMILFACTYVIHVRKKEESAQYRL